MNTPKVYKNWSELKNTYNNGPTGRLSVELLVTQVQHKRCNAVEKSQNGNSNKKLSRRWIISNQISGIKVCVIDLAGWDFVTLGIKPVTNIVDINNIERKRKQK